MPKKLRTPDEVKTDFKARGQTLSAWARANGYKPRNVWMLLNGIHKGAYGEAHEIAVKLGLKADIDQAS